ncbi:nidogen [Anopheles stephensi]|uniref:nidogen n=1 Tax=Anopheles stephensi TaxID=30069 RepID=UPI0016588425|nr:nidogen [Anopheles stephensi]
MCNKRVMVLLAIGVLLPSFVLAVDPRDLYSYMDEASEVLPRGDEEFQYMDLDMPAYFYNEKYDRVYINTNGILSFGGELVGFLNLPFPLGNPLIAPFYANVDTTLPNDTATIVYFKSRNPALLHHTTMLVHTSFSNHVDFEAEQVFVATWEHVGHFALKNDVLNSFQVAIIQGAADTFVQFLYPEDGINWIQGDTGDSGLPDVRAQAGFAAEDDRTYALPGSGTDNVRHLSISSNINQPGLWLYRVGPLAPEGNVEQPDQQREPSEPRSCTDGGRYKCHSAASCVNSNWGFCCQCKPGYYGNGFSCVKSDIPLRVAGKVLGTVNGEVLDTQLQSYIVMADGRTYTAISPLEEQMGTNLQLTHILGGTIAWLFAKPLGATINGYQLTGGKFNHTSTLQFATGEMFHINQQYSGLNVWDQLALDVNLSGQLPVVPALEKLQLDDYSVSFRRSGRGRLQAVSSHTFRVESQARNVSFTLYQDITYEGCRGNEDANAGKDEGMLKISRINLGYEPRERAVRMGMLSKMVVGDQFNPCDEANCGDNTVCVPKPDDTFDCNCKNGFTYVPYGNSDRINCVDIDECAGVNICDENAQCYNEPGGYSCRCNPGYEGNGYQCDKFTGHSQPTSSSYTVSTPPGYGSYNEVDSDPNQEEPYQCERCADYAECVEGQCQCRSGYEGDGVTYCEALCDSESVWNGEACVKEAYVEEEEIAPFCTILGCTCPTGYTLIEYAFNQICRRVPLDPEEEALAVNMPSCEVENNCSPHANCEWRDNVYRYECICNPGYDGNGYTCVEKEVSCQDDEEICDIHASCNYVLDLKMSVCSCNKGYEGDGRTCHLAPECAVDDDCGMNSECQAGLCVCQEGFERDLSDFCVRAGSCGGAYCAENAMCVVDPVQKIPYCHCPAGYIGDGVSQCRSIPPPCNVRNNCGLHASCVPSYRDQSTYECTCNQGFFGDGFVCTPERNCANIPSLCDQNARCESTTNGYQCICNDGFIGNGSVCNTAHRLDDGFLLISQGVANIRVPLNGGQGYPVTMALMSIGLDRDCAEGRIYWSDIHAKQIVSAKYDGTDQKPFITKDIVSPEGVAVDWISRRLYWTDSAKDTIEVASLENPEQRAVLVSKYLVNPRGIAVDPHQSKLYWSDWNRDGPKIEWSNLDGTERQLLVGSPQVALPNSIQVSMASGELCYADAGTQKVECIDTYSKGIRTIASNLSYPFGLAVTDDLFYWTDWKTKKIESINLYGVRQKAINSPVFGNHRMYGMTAVTDKCPLFHSPCVINNGDCTEDKLCLINPRAPSGRSCKCVRNCNDVILDY